MLLIPLALSAIMSFTATADDGNNSSAYNFGGSACSSQGTWTQSALTATQNLRRITNQLKDDPNCKSLGQAVTSVIENLNNEVKNASDSPGRTQRLSQIPSEISALRSFVNSNPAMKSKVLRLMMDRSIEGASISAQVPNPTNEERMSNSMIDFGSRLKRSTTNGISMLNQVIDHIPRLNECLMGDGQAALGTYIAMSTKIASSFASSGQEGIGSQLAVTISKLANLNRDIKFSRVLRKLNQQEFMASMACLMEVTSETYCQTRDAMGLFKEGMNSLMLNVDKLNRVASDNPFTGYYILNIHVPNVTKWLQKIQIGVDPKLPTDADFQTKILDEMNNYQKTVKRLLGDYNLARGTLKSLSSLEAKQNAVFKLITLIVDKMTSDNFGRDAGNQNFFTISRLPLDIPFYLLNIPVPDQVAGRSGTIVKLSYDDWLQANMKTLPIFQDPETLADNIGVRMRQLVYEANIASIEYFNKWFIVDKPSLVNESIVDVQYTVKESLVVIDSYLELLQQRMTDYNGDPAIIPTIVDTRIRISKILDKYAVIAEYGKKLGSFGSRSFRDKNFIKQIDADLIKQIEAYADLINIVYEQFMVQLARSGFLANRMVTFVNEDYKLLIEQKVNFTAAQQDLFNAVGMAAMERMLSMYAGNPANVQTDLNMALRINLGNMEALEALLKDNVISVLAELKMIKEGRSNVKTNSFGRLLKDYISSPWRAVSIGVIPVMWYWFKHSDRYPMTTLTHGPQSEFHDAQNVFSQFCIQSLAFNDQKEIRDLCQGAVLESPLINVGGYNIEYNKRLTAFLNDRKLTSQDKLSYNRSERVCAFRDYNRQNMVLYMTLGKKK
ncbi:MAG: hypothetical protein AB7I27_16105 [Bacteriovoracaceae bacterium]